MILARRWFALVEGTGWLKDKLITEYNEKTFAYLKETATKRKKKNRYYLFLNWIACYRGWYFIQYETEFRWNEEGKEKTRPRRHWEKKKKHTEQN